MNRRILFFLLMWLMTACGTTSVQAQSGQTSDGDGSHRKDRQQRNEQEEDANEAEGIPDRVRVPFAASIDTDGNSGPAGRSGSAHRSGHSNAGNIRNRGLRGRTLKDDGQTQTITDRGGRRTINMRSNRQEGVFVEIVMDFGPQDRDELIRKHPKLADYVELFPQQMDEHELQMSLTVRSQYQAKTMEELKSKNKNAYNLFRKHYKQPRNNVRNRR